MRISVEYISLYNAVFCLSFRNLYYPIILYRANFSKSCFTPTLRNFIVAFAFSPLPSTFITSPMPNLSCSIICPTCKGLLPVPEGAALVGIRCSLGGTMRRGGSCGCGGTFRARFVRANVGIPVGACVRGVLFSYVLVPAPAMRMYARSISLRKRLGSQNSNDP